MHNDRKVEPMIYFHAHVARHSSIFSQNQDRTLVLCALSEVFPFLLCLWKIDIIYFKNDSHFTSWFSFLKVPHFYPHLIGKEKQETAILYLSFILSVKLIIFNKVLCHCSSKLRGIVVWTLKIENLIEYISCWMRTF